MSNTVKTWIIYLSLIGCVILGFYLITNYKDLLEKIFIVAFIGWLAIFVLVGAWFEIKKEVDDWR